MITLDTAMGASSNREELQEMINRGVGVVAGAGLWRVRVARASDRGRRCGKARWRHENID